MEYETEVNQEKLSTSKIEKRITDLGFAFEDTETDLK